MSPPGNADRLAAQPIAAGGTATRTWIRWGRRFPELDLKGCRSVLVVAPHPDDETFGFGATAATLHSRGIGVQVVSVSDGGAAHPGLSPDERVALERRRRAELRCATSILDLPQPICLGLPDGELAAHSPQLTAILTGLLAARGPGAWCAVTWRGDGHPDHEAVGRAAAAAAAHTGAVLLEYPVWMWHWATPGDDAVPWQRAARITPDPAAAGRKRAAAKVYRSQLDAPQPGSEPVLPPPVAHRLLTVDELVFR